MLRGMDPEVWRELRMEAVRQGISVAKLIEKLWRETGGCNPDATCNESCNRGGLG